MRTLLLLLICLGPAAVCLGQETTPAPPLTAESAVAEAIRRNPRMTAAARNITAARTGARAAKALTNPTLTFAPAITPGGSDEELLLQQPLELNGTRSARKGIASAQVRRAEALAIVELREVVFDTKRAFYDLARAQELRRVAEDSLRFAEELDRGAGRQADEGLRPGIDRVQTGVEVTRARQRLTQARTEETTALAALNALLGRDPNAPAGELARLPGPTPLENAEALVSTALAARAEIAAEKAAGEEFRHEARLHRASGRPDLAPQLRSGSLTRGVKETGIGVAISLPLFDYGGRRNRVRQAEQQAQAQDARVASTRLNIQRDVEQAVARVRGAEALIREYEGGILDQTRRLLDARRTQFTAGLSTLLELLESQRTFRGVQAEYANALADYAEARAELERATGGVPAGLLPTAPARTAADAEKGKAP